MVHLLLMQLLSPGVWGYQALKACTNSSADSSSAESFWSVNGGGDNVSNEWASGHR